MTLWLNEILKIKEYYRIDIAIVGKGKSVERESILSLIERLVMAHSPSGNEKEVDQLIVEEFKRFCENVKQDMAGNIVAKIVGRSSDRNVVLSSHKDEIGMIVKRIEENGRLRITSIGGSRPWKYGEGVVDILGDQKTISGILSFGSMHVSSESKDIRAAQTEKPLSWDMVWIETKLSEDELKAAGIHIGTKVVIGKHRKRPFILGDYICSYALDDKACVASLIALAGIFSQEKPACDVYLVASSSEEIGAAGASWFANRLPAETLIAVEVAPVMPEYQTVNNQNPIILYQDGVSVYDEDMAKRLTELARSLGFDLQPACVTSYGSDASISRNHGLSAKAGCICFPTENTHGYEISSINAIENTIKLLRAYLV